MSDERFCAQLTVKPPELILSLTRKVLSVWLYIYYRDSRKYLKDCGRRQ